MDDVGSRLKSSQSLLNMNIEREGSVIDLRDTFIGGDPETFLSGLGEFLRPPVADGCPYQKRRTPPAPRPCARL